MTINNDAFTWLNSGLQLSNLGNFSEALKCYNKAIEIDPSYDTAWFNKGTILAKMQDINGAIVCFEKAIELFPEDADYYINLGLAYGMIRDYLHERESYKKALEFNCKDNLGTLYFNLAACLEKLNLNQEAILYYSKAIDFNTLDIEAYHNKSIILIKLRQFEQALDDLEKAIEISPDPSSISGQLKSIVEAILNPANKDKKKDMLAYLDIILMDI